MVFPENFFFVRREERKTPTGGPKERKKENREPREGWEDGTPPPHRDFKRRGVKERKKENRHAKRGMGRGQGPQRRGVNK